MISVPGPTAAPDTAGRPRPAIDATGGPDLWRTPATAPSPAGDRPRRPPATGLRRPSASSPVIGGCGACRDRATCGCASPTDDHQRSPGPDPPMISEPGPATAPHPAARPRTAITRLPVEARSVRAPVGAKGPVGAKAPVGAEDPSVRRPHRPDRRYSPSWRAISMRCTSRGALADLQDLGVAVEPADRVLVHEAVPAEDLGGVAGVVHRRVRRDQLGDRRLLLERLARAASSPLPRSRPAGRCAPAPPCRRS